MSSALWNSKWAYDWALIGGPLNELFVGWSSSPLIIDWLIRSFSINVLATNYWVLQCDSPRTWICSNSNR